MKPRQKPIRKVSTRQAKRLREYTKVRKAYLEEHPFCVMCGREATEVHHSAGKVGALLTHTPLFFALCFHHHRWVHDNIEEARGMGLICSKGDWNKQS